MLLVHVRHGLADDLWDGCSELDDSSLDSHLMLRILALETMCVWLAVGRDNDRN